MNDLTKHPQVESFLDKVCALVKSRELHEEIKLELSNHLFEIIEERMKEGESEDKAIEQAIDQMGDPLLIGKQLNHAHKPRIEWGLLGIISILIGIGLMGMYAVQLASDLFSPSLYSPGLLVAKGMFTLVGIGVMVLLYFFDYRKLQRFSWVFYITILILMICSVIRDKILGKYWMHTGFAQINYFEITPFLLMISLAGIMTQTRWKKSHLIFKLLILVLLPSVLYIIAGSYVPMAIYLIGAMVLSYFSKKSWKEFLGVVISFISMVCIIIYTGPAYLIHRLTSFLNPYHDPLGAGYMTIQSTEAIRSAELWGQGFGSNLKNIGHIHREMNFTYLVYSMGWMMGISILIFVTLFVYRMIGIVKNTSDDYGKLLVIGLLTIFTTMFIWPILMSVGLLPQVDIQVPFISYGGIYYLLHLAFMGIILSVYRRKNMNRGQGNNPIAVNE